MCSIGIVGYILVLVAFIHSWGPIPRLVAVTIAVAGQWSAMTPLVAWISDNVCLLRKKNTKIYENIRKYTKIYENVRKYTKILIINEIN
jgi:hypothetical protein